VNQVRCKMLTC